MDTSIAPELHWFPNLDSLSRSVAEEIASRLSSIRDDDVFTLVLSGGRTPASIYRILADSYRDKIPWNTIHLFWGDERYLPHDHSDSNYAMAYENLISRVPLPDKNIHPIPTEISPPESAANTYQECLNRFFHESLPSFDLVLLGVGKDGHTASLFPYSPVLCERDRWVVSVPPPRIEPVVERITLTIPVINNAREVFFIVSGREKKGAVDRALNLKGAMDKALPVSMVRAKDKTHWFLDSSTLKGA